MTARLRMVPPGVVAEPSVGRRRVPVSVLPRCDACQLQQVPLEPGDRHAAAATPSSAAQTIDAHRIVVAAGEALGAAAADLAEADAGGGRAALREVGGGQPEAGREAGGGEQRRHRRRQAQPPEHLGARRVDRRQHLAGGDVGRAHPLHRGEHERRERDEGDHEQDRRRAPAEPVHDRRDVGHPRRHHHQHEQRLRRPLERAAGRQHGADQDRQDECDRRHRRACATRSASVCSR